MLVDLGRNDLGRVSQIGTVRVEELMGVHRYSHVMHIESSVVGELAIGRRACDALRATFPAGTLSGAPKVRAMQIIDELETTRRGPYGGAVGYLELHGRPGYRHHDPHDRLRKGRVHVQAGAGIVADSVPELEYQETQNKAAALFRAIEVAADPAGVVSTMARVMIIDNYDSFTYNLVQYFGELGAEVVVHPQRRDRSSGHRGARADASGDLAGPKTPHEAGISVDAIRHFAGRVPVFGVCLGHQAIGAAFGAEVVRAPAAGARQDQPRSTTTGAPCSPGSTTRWSPPATTRWWWRPSWRRGSSCRRGATTTS